MSEFTAGVLFPKPSLERVEQHMQDFALPFIVRPLNDQWGALFIEGDNYEYPPVQPKLAEISRDVPLLYFENPEDSGWGFAVYTNGAQVASLSVSYDLDWNMTLDLAEQRYPNEDYYVEEFGDTWQQLNEEILSSQTYHDMIVQQYANLNLATLQIFGLDTTAIKTIADATVPDTYFDMEKVFAQSEIFKEALGIQEMSWMSYHYVTAEGDDDAE
jgi:hypothetical protein